MNSKKLLENKLRKLIRNEIQLLEGRFSRKPTTLKWQQSSNVEYPFYTSFSIPVGKTGIAYFSEEKIQKYFSNKLSKLLNMPVDLSDIKRDDFWHNRGRHISFKFELDGIKYQVESAGESPSAEYYTLRKSE